MAGLRGGSFIIHQQGPSAPAPLPAPQEARFLSVENHVSPLGHQEEKAAVIDSPLGRQVHQQTRFGGHGPVSPSVGGFSTGPGPLLRSSTRFGSQESHLGPHHGHGHEETKFVTEESPLTSQAVQRTHFGSQLDGGVVPLGFPKSRFASDEPLGSPFGHPRSRLGRVLGNSGFSQLSDLQGGSYIIQHIGHSAPAPLPAPQEERFVSVEGQFGPLEQQESRVAVVESSIGNQVHQETRFGGHGPISQEVGGIAGFPAPASPVFTHTTTRFGSVEGHGHEESSPLSPPIIETAHVDSLDRGVAPLGFPETRFAAVEGHPVGHSEAHFTAGDSPLGSEIIQESRFLSGPEGHVHGGFFSVQGRQAPLGGPHIRTRGPVVHYHRDGR